MATKSKAKAPQKSVAKKQVSAKKAAPAKSKTALSKTPVKAKVSPKPIVKKVEKHIPSVPPAVASNKSQAPAAPLPSKPRRRRPKPAIMVKPKPVKQTGPIVATVQGRAKQAPLSPPTAKSIQNKKLVNKTNINQGNPTSTPSGKTRYSDQELSEFKKLIDEKLVTARQELNYLQEQIVEMNENNADIQGSDWFDDSSIHAEVELLNNMAIRQRQFIQNLENALVRIENKTYGICSVTGNLIDKKRLLLVPHATKSIEAKHIEQATMVPEINQVAPDERVLRRAAEGKPAKKAGVKKSKSKGGSFDDDGEEEMEAPIEELDMTFEGTDD